MKSFKMLLPHIANESEASYITKNNNNNNNNK